MKTDFYNRSMFYGSKAITLRAASMLRKNMTLAEMVLWKKLKDKSIFKTKFRKQHPVNKYIVDFYCHEYKLVIEVDGELHNQKEVNEYDLNRTAVLNNYGIKVIRFTNYEVMFKMDEVLSRIQQIITNLTPLLRFCIASAKQSRGAGGLTQENYEIYEGAGGLKPGNFEFPGERRVSAT